MTLHKYIFPIMLALATVASGCKKDPCKDVNCLNGASCTEGDCICTAGFEGTDCGTQMRTKFLGSYNVTESCPGGNFTFQMNITNSSAGNDRVIINNFGGYNVSVSGTVNASSITIPNQQVDIQGTGATFSGSGQLSGNILTMTYTISVGASSETCTKTCTKI